MFSGCLALFFTISKQYNESLLLPKLTGILFSAQDQRDTPGSGPRQELPRRIYLFTKVIKKNKSPINFFIFLFGFLFTMTIKRI